MAVDTSLTGDKPVNEHRGHARGLILGFTMAESLLLLVFCLLLLTGAIIQKERQQRQDAQAQLQQQKDASIRLVAEVEALKKLAITNSRSAEEWQKLVAAKQQIDALAEQKLAPEELLAKADAIEALLTQNISKADIADMDRLKPLAELLKQQDLSPEELQEMLASVEQLAKALGKDKATPLPEQIAELLKFAAIGKEQQSSKPHEWPPIISLSETKDHFFKSGSAELSPAFRELISNKTAAQIAAIARQYNVDVVEVIGHTDEQRIMGVRSNLDSEMPYVLSNQKDIAVLRPGDNAGLGLARALAVSQVLSALPGLKDLTILPMSGAQLTLQSDHLTDGKDAGDSEGRRRIEIRVRKRNEMAAETGLSGKPVPLVSPKADDN